MDEQREYPFEFSVVMAVYNVEPFLREAVDSLIQQDFGFEKIQLIMVNDGSTDGSGAICDEYAARYPENVLVIHKENGGVSSARNEGLKYIQGRYINFLDSDDKLDANTMSEVYKFFVEHEEETDVAAIPMFFFDGESGAHRQNRKFRKGTRVINLLREWQVVQLSCSSAFIKMETAREMCFDLNLAYCEDGKEMLKCLLKKMSLGVVGKGAYQYRKRMMGASSAIQASVNNVEWYTPYLKGLIEATIINCMEKIGYIPRFVQFALMYDLQWRVLQEHIPQGIMNEKEIAEYKSLLFSLFSYFDDDVIMAQQDIAIEHKAFILKKKYGRDADMLWGYKNAMLYYQNTCICNLDKNKTYIDFITLDQSTISIEGYTVLMAGDRRAPQIYLEVNGEKMPCTQTDRYLDRMALDEPIYFGYGFQCTVSLDPEAERHTISLFCEINGKRIDRNKLVFGKHCPIASEYRNSYFCRDGYALTTDGKSLYVQKCGRKGRIQREYSYLKELWKKNKVGARKAVFARLMTFIMKPFQRKKIWLISDRIDKADDNGEAFFQYVAKRKDVKAYFAISPKSPDYQRLKKVGRVIPFLGWRYKSLYLLADSVISSQGEEYIFHPFQGQSVLYRDLAQSQKFVFLQHGITKDDLSAWLNRFNKNISLFVTVTYPEYQSILEYNYYYSKKEVKLTGFPRYDRLYHCEKRIITIMPTWRAYLVTRINSETGKRELKAGFCESQYFAMYDKLINDQRLFDAAERLGYTISFLNHPNMSSTADVLSGDQRMKKLGGETSYREVFAQSDLVITDYSSIAFDFAYLRKPVVYYQADKDEFFSGAHTYEKGYFDYETDGFGEVEYSVEALVERIIEYMENDCQLKDEYRKRIDATFPFSDQNNCQRVYEEIVKLEGKA